MGLTARKVETAKAGKYSDGNGLFLLVKSTGGKSWVLRYQLNGRRRDLGLGGYPEISLAEAREKTLEYRKQIKAGFDPLSHRQKQTYITFKEASIRLIENKKHEWKNEKHCKQWLSTLENYAFPFIGEIFIHTLEVNDIIPILEKIWHEKPETASRLRGRIEAVFDYAIALKYRTGNNPALWKGNLDHLLPKASKVKTIEHHSALPYLEIACFMKDLSTKEGISAKALEMVILTACRSGEVRGMQWQEIDFSREIWIIPSHRMKAGKEHIVPLSKRALEILNEMPKTAQYVFESQTKQGAILSDMSLSAVLKRMGKIDITVHGFRSTFRDWAGETTAFPREVIEHAMAHKLKDKAEAAYARGTLLEKRRELMKAWHDYVVNS